MLYRLELIGIEGGWAASFFARAPASGEMMSKGRGLLARWGGNTYANTYGNWPARVEEKRGPLAKPAF